MMVNIFRGEELLLCLEIGDMSVDEMALVSKKILNYSRISPEGFHELFLRVYKYSKTHIEAYENAEKVHSDVFGCNRYANYETFQVMRSQLLKRQR